MIQFNTLKITQDGKNLIINASVKNLSYYTNVLIGSIIIDNQDTYSVSGPSSNPIYEHSFADNDVNKILKEGYSHSMSGNSSFKWDVATQSYVTK